MTKGIDINPVENASADLFSAAIMCDVTERSLSEIRAWLKIMGKDPANVPAIMEVDVMLFTIKDTIKQAKATIDQFVTDAIAARRDKAA